MAGKETTLVLLDVGASMYKPYKQVQGKNITRLELAVDCKEEDIEDGNTFYIQPLDSSDLEFYRNLTELPNHDLPQIKDGDIFDALDKPKAVSYLDQHVNKMDKKIFVLTAGFGETQYNEKQIAKLIKMIEKVDVKINFIAMDFMNEYDVELDDPTKPGNQELLNDRMLNAVYQSQEQSINSHLIYQMVQELRNHMIIFPANIAFELYSQFIQNKSKQELHLEEIFKQMMIHLYKLPSLKKYSAIGEFSNEPTRNIVRNDTIHYNPEDPNMTPIERENIIKGYQYGRNLIPVYNLMEEK